MMRNTAPMILVPVSRLMQQQHASSRVQCDILEPPAPESALSGIFSISISHWWCLSLYSWVRRIFFTAAAGSMRHILPSAELWHRVTVSLSASDNLRDWVSSLSTKLFTLCDADYILRRKIQWLIIKLILLGLRDRSLGDRGMTIISHTFSMRQERFEEWLNLWMNPPILFITLAHSLTVMDAL